MLAIRRIIEQRKGKRQGDGQTADACATQPKTRVTAESLVRAYRKETQRQKLLVKRAA